MGTKIYNAYRLDKKLKPWLLIKYIQERGTELAHQILCNVHDRAMYEVISKNSDRFKEDCATWSITNKYSEDQIKRIVAANHAMDFMRLKYKESSNSGLRSYYDFDASVTFRELNGYWYMQIYVDMAMRNLFDFVTSLSQVIDYHYQNSTDKDDNISNRDWNKRRKVWDALYSTEVLRKTFLKLEIMNFDEFERWSWNHLAQLREKIQKESENFS